MSDTKEKLKRLLKTPGLSTGSDVQNRLAELARKREEGAFEIEGVVEGRVVENDAGAFYLVQQRYSMDTPHGPVTLGDVMDAAGQHIAFGACDDELVDFDPRVTAFVDTETGGLVGGAGNVAFLVGVGYFENDEFVLDQCFMRDYDEEEPMLHYLDNVFKRMESVVSYNGKSFDLPLMRTRFIQNRIPYRLDASMHFDLLHTARRFWKRRLKDCSLGNVEREILGMPRHNDVNSALIPQLYFDYLRSRDARPLERVFYHHKMDILSLVALTAWVSRCLADPDSGFSHADDKLSLVRVHMRQKKYEDAIGHARAALDTDLDDLCLREAYEQMALAAKRLNDYVTMEEALVNWAEAFPNDIDAHRELAKHYEHRKRDLPAALHHCNSALEVIAKRRQARMMTDKDPAYAHDFRHRLERIKGKLERL